MAGELVVLGTSGERPNRYRNPNGYVLRWNGHTVLLDPGEGSLRQLALVGIAPTEFTQILITHFHGDHYLGLPSVLETLVTDGVSHSVDLYYPVCGQAIVDGLLVATGAHVLDGTRLRLRPIPLEGCSEAIGDIRLEAMPLEHSVPTVGYRLVCRDGPPAQDAESSGAVFAFVMDTAPCETATRLAAGADVLLCEATYLDHQSDLASAQQHMTAHQAGTLARDCGAKRLLLTHFTHRQPEVNAFLHEARRVFNRVDVARDTCRYAFERFADD